MRRQPTPDNPTGTWRPKGHRSLGYAGKGTYKCQCGEEFSTGSDKPFSVGDPHADARIVPGIGAMHDQWDAHCRVELTK
jgi:hypothetical protein